MTSGYWVFLIMLLPVIAAVVSFLKFRTIDIKEIGISLGVALTITLLTLFLGGLGMQLDTETHSGYIVRLEHTPKWEAEWVEVVTETHTDSKGNQYTTTHNEVRSETHYPTWTAVTTVGDKEIDKATWDEIRSKYGTQSKRGHRPDYDSGDKYDYYTVIDDNGYYPTYPVSMTRMWQNKYKNTDSIVVGEPIPDEEASKIGLPEYPKNNNLFVSNRIIGSSDIPIYKWDQLNTVVGERNHINLILVNMTGKTMEHAVMLRQYWQNGKKNDLVICYNKDNEAKPWCYVFGWSKTELVKQNITTLFLTTPIDENIIPLIDKEIDKNFESYDWSSVEVHGTPVATWVVLTAFILMSISQGILYYKFHNN